MVIDLETSGSQHHNFGETESQEQALRECARSAIEALESYKASVRLVSWVNRGLVGMLEKKKIFWKQAV